METRRRFVSAVFVWLLLAGFAVSEARALLYSIDKDPNHQLYGSLNQNAIPNGGQFMCGPTAAVNSFMYLQNAYPNHYGNSLIGDADGDANPNTNNDMITVAQTVAGANYMNTKAGIQGGTTGTWDDMFIIGKHDYMEAVAPGKTTYAAQLASTWAWAGRPADETPVVARPAWVQDNTTPTWSFLWNELNSCADVEILINWTDEGGAKGHYLTVKSFLWNDVNNNLVIDFAENAMIDYIDPATGAAGASQIWQFGFGNVLDVAYGGNQTQVNMIMSEVPEPASLMLLLVGLALFRRRRT